jgi:hypothetical protein
MRKAVAIPLLAIALLLGPVVPSLAWHGHHPGVRTRFFVGVGPGFWWGPPYPYWWQYPPYYVYPPPPIVLQAPPAYVQQEPAPPSQTYWYYCPSANAYYPNAQTCPEAWIKVPPRPQ